jgi:5'-nucleotidase (lipoprotein e(P4) family)
VIRIRPLASAACAMGAALMLSGCIAAAMAPIAAGGAGFIKKKRQRDARAASVMQQPQPGQPVAATPGGAPQLTAMTSLPPPSGGTPAAVGDARPAPAGMQFLYGSGEAAALSIQAYQSLWNYVSIEIGYLRDKTKAQAVILNRGSTLAAPRYDECGKRPLAVVFDIDETVLLNLGYEADEASRGLKYDESRWGRWEATGADKVAAVPGAAETIAALRREGIAVVFNTNRSMGNAEGTIKAIEAAGLGPVTLHDTLWLKGAGESGKDERRWRIAQTYCVVAMAGDQLGDFTDLFNDPAMPIAVRRNSAVETMVNQLWGRGWFMLPNPVYGTGLKGAIGEVFPADKRWTDPGAMPAPAPNAPAAAPPQP